MIDPRAEEASERGIQAVTRSDWPAAVSAFLESVQWAPDSVQAWYNLANAQSRSGNNPSALAACLRAVRLDPKWPNLQILTGNVHGELGHFPAAIECYLTALEQEPRSIITAVNLAHAFERMQMHEEAYECYDYAVVLGADRSTAWSAAYHAAMMSCRWDLADEAKQRFDRYLAEGGENRAAPFQMLTMDSTRAMQLESARSYWNANFGSIRTLDSDPR